MRAFYVALIGGTLLAGPLLNGCAAPSTRIATGLQRYGIDAQRARCVGDRLQRDLSLGQLQQLGRAAAAYGKGDTDPTRLTTGDLFRVAGEIRDPEIVLAVGTAAAGCGAMPGAPVPAPPAPTPAPM